MPNYQLHDSYEKAFINWFRKNEHLFPPDFVMTDEILKCFVDTAMNLVKVSTVASNFRAAVENDKTTIKAVSKMGFNNDHEKKTSQTDDESNKENGG